MSLPLISVLSAAAAAADGPPAWVQFLPMVAIVGVMWFLFLRPQMRQQKEQKAKLDALKKGDQVLTGGGLIGRITKVDDVYAEVELAPNVKVRALKSTITDVIPPGGTPAAND
ncbi:MAG: preprotein translocase subunit YajC [Sphingomonadales bacterium]|nr:preprotein translocase subunit YajC [Sphingomonadales bacterium]